MGDVKWIELLRVSETVPFVCMGLLSRSSSNLPSTVEDWVAVGDGKGHMTIVSIVGDIHTPKVGITLTWSAGVKRLLLGTYWCRSLGSRSPLGLSKMISLEQHNQHFQVNEQKSMRGMYDIIYGCPETILRLIKPLQSLVESRGIALLAIDEVHCVSKWGHDFQPDYKWQVGLIMIDSI